VRKSYQEGEALLTAQGALLGTPRYMSPEQVTAKPVTALTDVWAAGILAYRMLAGRFPFDNANPTVLLADMVMKPVPPLGPQAPEAPVGVVGAIERALRKSPSERHADMHAFLGALLEGAREVGIELSDPRDRASRP
jgi:serine/threonine-protein kinase